MFMKPGGVAHDFNPSTQEAEQEDFPEVWAQSGLFTDFQNSLDCTERPCVKQ